MLKKTFPEKLVKSIFSRPLHIGNVSFQNQRPKTDFSPPKREDIKYRFTEIENDSMIKLLSHGYISPSLMKIPDSKPTDQVVRDLIENLSKMDLTTYEKGMEQLKRAGIFGALIPKRFGGLGLNLSQYAYLMQNENLIDWSLVLIAHQNLCAEAILKYGSYEQQDRYLPKMAKGELLGAFCLSEQGSGIDMFSMESTAILQPLRDTYILNGTKNWVVNGYHADVFIVFALSRDSMEEGGRDFITGFIIDRNNFGISVSEPYDIDWLHNCKVSDVTFDNISISIDQVLSEENGGYKIAHDIQNNARYVIAASMAGIMRKVVNDLVSIESSLITPTDALVNSLIHQCKIILYSVESTLYFTTRFADNYLQPEIQLESAALKVYSIERTHELLEISHNIYNLIDRLVPPEFRKYYKIINGIQNFMGSNFYNRLYIGGTVIELSNRKVMELKKRLRSTMQNVPWLKSTLKDAFNPMLLFEKTTDPLVKNPEEYLQFIQDLRSIFMRISKTKVLLITAMNNLKHDTFEYQHLMTAMSNIGIITYTLACCIARANTTFGDFEINASQTILQESVLLIDKSVEILEYTQELRVNQCNEILMEDIEDVKRYVPINILEIRRHLVDTELKLPPWSEFKYNR